MSATPKFIIHKFYVIIIDMPKIFFVAMFIGCLLSFGFEAKAVAKVDTKKVPIIVDTDKDYLSDAWEKIIGTDPNNPDTDGDKYLDGTEVAAGFDPLDKEPKQIAKLIKVDLKTQHLWYYFGDKILADFPISSGLKNTPTPKGEFKILDKVPVKSYGGKGYNFYFPNTKWNLHFTTGKYRFYIHGAYWHNKFGQPMSHGCVNVSYANMEALYWFAQVGTKVIIN